jgi:hypothetical protein
MKHVFTLAIGVALGVLGAQLIGGFITKKA